MPITVVRRRRLPLLLGVLVAALLAPFAATAHPHGGPPAWGSSHSAVVMTRNLYLGADLGPVVAALAGGDPNQIVAAATATWETVKASEPEARLAAVADEIARTRPAVVGLQEVTTWTLAGYDPRTQSVVGLPATAYDFLDLLLDELALRGLDYREAAGATAENFSSPFIPVLAGEAFPTAAVRLLDRDVIIHRAGVKVSNARTGQFQAILGPPAFPLPVKRGWGSVDVRTRKASFRFVNTHFEAFGPEALREAQAAELFAAQDALALEVGHKPVVWAGDFNSPAPDGGGYLALTARLKDAWILAHGDAPGATCCQADDLRNETSQLSTRIDLLLVGEGVRVKRAAVVGDEPVSLPGGVRWASDHAGVVARIVVR